MYGGAKTPEPRWRGVFSIRPVTRRHFSNNSHPKLSRQCHKPSRSVASYFTGETRKRLLSPHHRRRLQMRRQEIHPELEESRPVWIYRVFSKSKSVPASYETYVLAHLGTGATGRMPGIIELSLPPPSSFLPSEFRPSSPKFLSPSLAPCFASVFVDQGPCCHCQCAPRNRIFLTLDTIHRAIRRV